MRLKAAELEKRVAMLELARRQALAESVLRRAGGLRKTVKARDSALGILSSALSRNCGLPE